jgi:thiol-disulfide isomerase/thioredoxin
MIVMMTLGSSRIFPFIIAAALSLAPPHALAKPPAVGDAVQLRFTAPDGKTIDLRDMRGKIVLIDCWASSSAPSMQDADHITQIEHRYGPKGLVVIGINFDAKIDDMHKAEQAHQFDWPEHFDGKKLASPLAVDWGITQLPQTFLVSPDGKLLFQAVGPSKDLDGAIDRALLENPPTLVDPRTAETADHSLKTAAALFAVGKTDLAMAAMAAIPPQARNDPDFSVRFDALAAQMEPAAGPVVDQATKDVDDEKYPDAALKLVRIAAALATTPTGKRAAAMVADLEHNADSRPAVESAQRELKAQSALAGAEALAADKNDLDAYAAYQSVAQQFPGTDAAHDAAAAVARFDADPAFAKAKADADLAKRQAQATKILSLGENYAAADRPDLARDKFNQVMSQYPGTPAADQAATDLQKLSN